MKEANVITVSFPPYGPFRFLLSILFLQKLFTISKSTLISSWTFHYIQFNDERLDGWRVQTVKLVQLRRIKLFGYCCYMTRKKYNERNHWLFSHHFSPYFISTKTIGTSRYFIFLLPLFFVCLFVLLGLKVLVFFFYIENVHL